MAATVLSVAGGPAVGTATATTPDRTSPVMVEPVEGDGEEPVGASGGGRGPVTVAVRLTEAPVAVTVAAGEDTPAAQDAQRERVEDQQTAVGAQVEDLGATEVAAVSNALNAIVVEVDPAAVPEIEALDGVEGVRIVRDHELHVSDADQVMGSVGALSAHATGADGTGVTLAVIDSGIDYTHANLGGPGTPEAYAAAWGTSHADPRNTTIDPALFPTAKVVGGYDFVGESWPSGPLTPDPNPIDANGHGTHVADIAAGIAPSPGAAPGAALLAFKACSAVSGVCSGVAMLQAVDAALDPDGDGDLSDRADVLNLSLGSPYGQVEDDLTAALDNAAAAGAVVVASAGNSGNRPYITGSPAIGDRVISVAQTQVPEAEGFGVRVDTPSGFGSLTNTATVPWAPVGAGASGELVRVGRGCAFDALEGDPAGRIALVDRGSCAVSEKVDRLARRGAIGVLVANNVGGEVPSFTLGAGSQFVPTLVISLADGTRLKEALTAGTVSVTFDASTRVSLDGSMVRSSARGPAHSSQRIKPDLGAPGAVLSAQVGTGTASVAFGGTSGAAPVVAGAAAVLRGAHPDRSPEEIRAVLMNTARTGIRSNPLVLGDEPAPVTRIGAGEVRVQAALDSTTAAWDAAHLTGSLSFGRHGVADKAKLTRTVVVRNHGSTPTRYRITTQFRDPADQASGAVRIQAPAAVVVPAGGTRTFDVTLRIDARALPSWTLDGGVRGGDGALLDAVEFDGLVLLDGGSPTTRVHLPWQVLPHRAAQVEVDGDVEVGDALELDNRSRALAGGVEVFALTGTSPEVPADLLPGPGANRAVVDLAAVGVRATADGLLQVGIDTFRGRSHPAYPAEFVVTIDSDADGDDDHVMFTGELNGFGATGQTVVFVGPVSGSPPPRPRVFLDADLGSGNAIMSVPLSDVGLTPTSTFAFRVDAVDNYFTGAVTDAIGPMTVTLGSPRFTLEGPATLEVPAGRKVKLAVTAPAGGAVASPSQLGLLLLLRDAPGASPDERSADEAVAVLVEEDD